MLEARSIKDLSAVYHFWLIHAMMASHSCNADPDLMVLGVFHALQGDVKGTGGGGGFFFFTKATYLYGNYSSAAVRNFGDTVPLSDL